MSPDDGQCREAPTAVCSVLRSGHKFITQVEVHVQQIAVHILRSGRLATFAWRRALVRVCAATPAAAPAGRVAGDVGRGAGGARAPRPRAAPRAAPRGAPPRGPRGARGPAGSKKEITTNKNGTKTVRTTARERRQQHQHKRLCTCSCVLARIILPLSRRPQASN